MTNENLIYIPVSLGELVDKITVLEIKLRYITEESKRRNVVKELELLQNELGKVRLTHTDTFFSLKQKLASINDEIWKVIEQQNAISEREDTTSLRAALGTAASIKNNERTRIKKEINLSFGSAIIEEKSFQ